MKPLIILCLSLLLSPTLSAANQHVSPTKIIVTLTPLSGLVAMLLPNSTSQCLLSAGADPHHFQPSPRQVDMLNQGNLLIRASKDDRGWPIRSQKNATYDLWKSDSHAWLQFDTVAQALPKLARRLIAQFPGQQQSIEKNLALALKSVKSMEKKWAKPLQQLKNKGVFMQHPAWHDLLESKHVPVRAVLESHQHGHEHGPLHLEDALNTLKKYPNSLLLGSKQHSNRSLEWLQKQQPSASSIIKLDALGKCNQPWDALMQANLDILSNHL